MKDLKMCICVKTHQNMGRVGDAGSGPLEMN